MIDMCVLITEYEKYRIFIDGNGKLLIYHNGKVKSEPFLEGPPELTVTIQILMNKLEQKVYDPKKDIDKIRELFSSIINERDPIKRRILVNTRLMYLNHLIINNLKGIHNDDDLDYDI